MSFCVSINYRKCDTYIYIINNNNQQFVPNDIDEVIKQHNIMSFLENNKERLMNSTLVFLKLSLDEGLLDFIVSNFGDFVSKYNMDLEFYFNEHKYQLSDFYEFVEKIMLSKYVLLEDIECVDCDRYIIVGEKNFDNIHLLDK